MQMYEKKTKEPCILFFLIKGMLYCPKQIFNTIKIAAYSYTSKFTLRCLFYFKKLLFPLFIPFSCFYFVTLDGFLPFGSILLL